MALLERLQSPRFTFQESGNWKSGDLLTFLGGFRGTFGVISLFKILKNGNLSIFWKGFCVNAVELFEVFGPAWNFWGNVEK